jgi:hypothetical protein
MIKVALPGDLDFKSSRTTAPGISLSGLKPMPKRSVWTRTWKVLSSSGL